MSIDTEFFGGQPPKWVSGTTYALDFIVRSPASQHHYVRIVAGAGTTDPSADGTNWAVVGATRIKSIQTIVIEIVGSAATATGTISSVATTGNKTTLKNLGAYTTSGGPYPAETVIYVPELTNATTVTARRVGVGGGTLRCQVEITEVW
jgi:hypothetical protein